MPSSTANSAARRLHLGLAFASLCLLVTSCVLRPTAPPDTADWAFTGKMAVRNAQEASSFNVDWVQQPQRFAIELSGPLGASAVEIIGAPGKVVLTQGKDEIEAASLTALLANHTDLDLPLSDLRYWVHGELSPVSAKGVERDEDGRLTRFRQSGWQVTISDYYDTPYDAPRKLLFERGDESGKLIIRAWHRF